MKEDEMNAEKVQAIINKVISDFRSRTHHARQYPVAKHQIKTLTELGIIDLMPKNFGHGDAKIVIAEAQDDGKTVMNAYGEGESVGASALYKALHEVEPEDEVASIDATKLQKGMQVRIKPHTVYDFHVRASYATLVTPVEHHVPGGQIATIRAIFINEMEDEHFNPVNEYIVELEGFGMFAPEHLELVSQ
jgi:hypothetical protein